MNKYIVILFTLLAGMAAANAQTKVAHINSGELMQIMPEMKDIQEKVEKRQQQYQTQLLNMQQDIQKKSMELQKDTTSPLPVLEIKQKELEDLYSRFQQLQGTAQDDLAALQQELLEPLMKKLKDAIEAVAKEKGYDYVMDSTDGGGLIYGNPSHDLMGDVKKKLGLP
jgi:outer membrane protein